jgi:uncharacterized lipoprotein YajG
MNDQKQARQPRGRTAQLFAGLGAMALLAGCGSHETMRTTTTEQTRTQQAAPMSQPDTTVTTTKSQVTVP